MPAASTMRKPRALAPGLVRCASQEVFARSGRLAPLLHVAAAAFAPPPETVASGDGMSAGANRSTRPCGEFAFPVEGMLARTLVPVR